MQFLYLAASAAALMASTALAAQTAPAAQTTPAANPLLADWTAAVTATLAPLGLA